MSSSVDQNSSDNNENLCVLCFKNVDIYSVGICDHPVCYECSTRMRVLCRQNECPICRGDMPKVVFTGDVSPFTTLFSKHSKTNLQDSKFGLIFASFDIQREYNNLLEHRCYICSGYERCCFKTFGQLKDHMRREHELFYCDICVENVKIFSTERRTYTRQELGIHRRKGDPDNTSHRGHPLCEFCDIRFMDSDELFRHLRRNHLFCHFCDADGRHLYYKNLEDLQKHFREEHYLCEEGDCRNVSMAAAFRTEIDLKAHIAAAHGRNLGKSASKQVRTLELAFTLTPRNTARKNQAENRMEEEGAVGYEPGVPGGGQDRMFHNPLTPMDFPALGGGSGGTVVTQLRPSVAFNSKANSKLNIKDFPSLGNSNRSTSGVTITTNRNSEVNISRNNFPTLGKPSTSKESRVTLSVHNNQIAKAPHVSIQVVNHNNNNGNGNHASASGGQNQMTTTTNQKKSEAFPALATPSSSGHASQQQPQWVQVKAKKPQPEKQSKVAPAPQLPPGDLSQFPNLSKGKLNRKSSVQVPMGTNWVNLNALKKEQQSDNKKTNQQSVTSNNKEKPKSTTTTSAEANKETTKNNVQEDKNKKKKKVNKNNDDEETEPYKETTTQQKQQKQSEFARNVNNNVGGRKETAKPPPGFKLPPPPGFRNKMGDFPCLGVPNDLTFTTSSGQSYSITSRPNNYKQPTNFAQRNQNIMKKLTMVSGNETVNDFKVRSEMFRNGQLGAEKYYEYCKRALAANFDDFFPEMLVLLPDIEKQQALFGVHSGKSKKNLLVCENCKQVILKRELSEHYKYHGFENQFSSQLTAQVNSNNNNNNNNVWNGN